VARSVWRLAAVSVSAPVLVIVDDADQVDAGLAVTMIESLAGRYNGRVLMMVAVRPGAALKVGRSRAGSSGGWRPAELTTRRPVQAQEARSAESWYVCRITRPTIRRGDIGR
jgi:hypothetical protein